MRLRELRYPILRWSVFGLTGGGIRRPRHWNNIIANDMLKGHSDSDIYYDSSGGMLEVERFILSDRWPIYPFLNRADYFFVLKPKRKFHKASVDAELRLVRRFTLHEFCDHLVDLALSHPEWWGRQDPETYAPGEIEGEYRTMYDGVTSFEEAIKKTLDLDALRIPRPPKAAQRKSSTIEP